MFCILYPMLCILYPMLCILYPMLCILYPMFCILYPMFCILYPVSYMYPVSQLLCPLCCWVKVVGVEKSCLKAELSTRQLDSLDNLDSCSNKPKPGPQNKHLSTIEKNEEEKHKNNQSFWLKLYRSLVWHRTSHGPNPLPPLHLWFHTLNWPIFSIMKILFKTMNRAFSWVCYFYNFYDWVYLYFLKKLSHIIVS